MNFTRRETLALGVGAAAMTVLPFRVYAATTDELIAGRDLHLWLAGGKPGGVYPYPAGRYAGCRGYRKAGRWHLRQDVVDREGHNRGLRRLSRPLDFKEKKTWHLV